MAGGWLTHPITRAIRIVLALAYLLYFLWLVWFDKTAGNWEWAPFLALLVLTWLMRRAGRQSAG